jgi:hypothetical protein
MVELDTPSRHLDEIAAGVIHDVAVVVELEAIVQEVRARVAATKGDFMWTEWKDQAEALAELDEVLAELRNHRKPRNLHVLLAATGSLQELSLSSGWSEEFLKLAARYDAVIAGHTENSLADIKRHYESVATRHKRATADLMRLIIGVVCALLTIWFLLLFWK